MEQLDFLDRVWGLQNDNHYVQFQQKRQDEAGNRTGDPSDTKEFRWPLERDRIGRYMSLRLEEDLYFAVPLYKSATRRSTDRIAQRAAYVDNDGVDGSKTGGYRLPPSITVFSSPGHQHDYWITEGEVDPQRLERVGFEISAAHRHDSSMHDDMVEGHKHCGTDPGGYDSTQILRIPGTLNTKGGGAHRIEWVDNGHTYTIEQLEEAYPKTENSSYVGAVSLDELPADLPDITSVLAQLGGRQDLLKLFTEEPTGFGTSSGWDERLFMLENEMFRMGFSAPEVFVVARQSACNKFARGVKDGKGGYTPRPNPDLDLWRDVYKAEQTHGMRTTTHMASTYDASNSTFEIAAVTPSMDMPQTVAVPDFEIDLLTEEEHVRVDSLHTIIDDYVDWATSKTDAAPVYHIASIFTILSLVFGEYGHAHPKFGKLRLNLWFLVMGKTTRARKSTSRNLMLKIIKGLQNSTHQYDEGSNFTSEGLENALLEKPRQSSLIHRDEVQGMFSEVKGKNYMAGLNDVLTALYDGEVSGKKRASGDVQNAQSAEVNFVLFFMGIVSQVTEVLTIDDFRKGFLARFIHVIGEAPPRTRESEWLDQAPLNEVISGDPGYLSLIKNLMLARTHWAKLSPDRVTISIRWTDEAWKRWNDANWDLGESVRNHERAEILEAALDRMGKSAIKAATLLAMADKRDKVTLDDALVAISYLNGWAADMVKSSTMVSESYWKKDMNQLVDICIRKGGWVKWEEAYSKMDKKPGEFAQLVEGAVMSGAIRSQIDPTSKQRFLEAVL